MSDKSISTTDRLSPEYLSVLLTHAAQKAVDGELTDTDRVSLLNLALTVCADEFYRIASHGQPNAVKPEALLLLQQITLLCEDEVDPDKLMMNIIHTKKRAKDATLGEANDGPSLSLVT